MSTQPALILASASPRRADLLRQAGYEFAVHPADFDEEDYYGKLPPAQLAGFLAKAKVDEIASRFEEDVTLAADTVVAFGDTAAAKPEDESEAREMIDLLAGTTHVVITGVAVRCPAQKIDLGCTVMSAVRMRTLSARSLDEYIASGRWKGKAGGYGIQDPEPLVTCVGGSLTNVIGLPMEQTRQLLKQAGIFPNSLQVP